MTDSFIKQPCCSDNDRNDFDHIAAPSSPIRTTATPEFDTNTPRQYTTVSDVSLTPPLASDDPSILASSPIVGNVQQRREIRERKRIRSLQATNLLKKDVKAVDEKRRKQEDIEAIEYVLETMERQQVRFGDLLDFVFDPANYQGDLHWGQAFNRSGTLTRYLNWWTSSGYSKSVREEVAEWATSYVAGLVAGEARSINDIDVLKTSHTPITPDLALSFSLQNSYNTLCSALPTAVRILRTLCTSPRAETQHTERRKARTTNVLTHCLLTCLGEYSHANNLHKRLVGLYLYSTGAQRQLISVLSSLGITESYSNLVTWNTRRTRSVTLATDASKPSNEPAKTAEPFKEYTGTLRQLSQAMRAQVRKLAATGVYGIIYDNINMAFRNAEQILGRHDSQENGTCATAFPLFKARIKDLDAEVLQKAVQDARPLRLKDIILTDEESSHLHRNIVFTVLRIIIKHGGEKFKKFEKCLLEEQPCSEHKIEVHKTDLHPLPAMNIDESTIIGNAEVDAAIVDELKIKDIPLFWKRTRLVAGDQLSLARLRSMEMIRAGQEDEYRAFDFFALVNGLFHAKIADIHGLLETHFGKAESEGNPSNPGSLSFHNTRLHRLPITLSSPPPFRVCRDLVFVSLYARVLHCLLLVSGETSLDEYVEHFTSWDTLVSHAEAIVEKYINPGTVTDLQYHRQQAEQNASESGSPPMKEGDMVYEAALCFMRDALLSREFTDSVKAGDSGRILLCLKMWALSYRGSGRTKYAYEMLHVIHNLEVVYPEGLRLVLVYYIKARSWERLTQFSGIVLNNWLANPSGKPNSFVELDLVQEHLNYWIKVFYKAHGSNASWEWLEHIAPCTDVLRRLATNFHNILGADQGTKHAEPDLTKDIETLMVSLDEYDVYRLQPGRVFPDGASAIADVVGLGYQNLTESSRSPLAEYNSNFRKLQQRRKNPPVTQKMIDDMALRNGCGDPQVGIPNHSEASVQPGSEPVPGMTDPLNTDTEDDDGAMILGKSLDALNGDSEEVIPRVNLEDVAFDMDVVEVDIPDDISVDSDDEGI
ncbi:hypothetical protein NP233_g1885 [Leucocoprinus birnbaumii]|uniref:DUF6589 domain-containing protein n=1 Tax=Leucocoprinus birnbaumii TaxID=56174 RepID=A0AAD5YZ76_9AGAR|nr:hypothetical protein NP233_g1885 [Leucocoprinus birnbaumii]